MGMFDEFPWLNTHELNLDWLLGEVKRMRDVFYKGTPALKDSILFVGDSHTVGTGAGPAGSEERLQKRFSHKTSELLGLTEYNYAVGGARFTGTSNLIETQLLTAAQDLSSDVISRLRYVVITGGVNDMRHIEPPYYTELLDRVQSCCNRAHALFPDAEIVLAFSNLTLDGIPPWWLEYMSNVCREVPAHSSYGIKVVKNAGFSVSGVRSLWDMTESNPGLHLNAEGHAIFGAYLAQAIMGMGDHVEFVAGTMRADSGYGWETFAPVLLDVDGVIHTDAERMTVPDTLTGTVKVGTIPAALAPRSQMGVGFSYGDKPAGIAQVTASGNVYIELLDGVSITSGSFLFPSMSWIPGSNTVHE